MLLAMFEHSANCAQSADAADRKKSYGRAVALPTAAQLLITRRRADSLTHVNALVLLAERGNGDDHSGSEWFNGVLESEVLSERDCCPHGHAGRHVVHRA